MTGDLHQGQDHRDTPEPLPPIVAARSFPHGSADDALAGAPLPPYRRGLHPSRLIDDTAIRDGAPTAAGPETGEAAAGEEIDAWEARRAAWDANYAAPAPDDEEISVGGMAAEDIAARLTAEEAPETTPYDVGPSGAEEIVAGEPPWAAEAAAVETAETGDAAETAWGAGTGREESWTGGTESADEPAAIDEWEEAPEPWADADPVADGWASAVDEAATAEVEPEFVVPGWDDSWTGAEPEASAAEPTEAETEAPAAAEAGVEPEAEEEAAGAEEESADAWLAAGTAGAYPWDVPAEPTEPMGSDATFAAPAAGGAEAPFPPTDTSAEGPPVWDAWEPEDETAPVPADMDAAWASVPDEQLATSAADVTIDTVPDAFEAAAEEPAAHPTDDTEPDAFEAAAEEPAAHPTDDELVARVPPTPLDSWYHAEKPAGADETWEAFGRALEEAAAWGDLGATIATGRPADAATQAPSAEEAAEAVVEASEPAEEAKAATPAVEEEEEEPAVEAEEEMPAVEAEEEITAAALAEGAAAEAEPAEPEARAPTGTDVSPPTASPPATTGPAPLPAEKGLHELASKLEEFARRLREEGGKGVEHALVEGDRLEASLAAFIAGYVAARRE